MKKIKLIFFGNEQLAQGIKAKPIVFDTLQASDTCEIQAVILTNPNHRKPYAIEKAAKAANIPVFFSKSSDEIMTIISQYDDDTETGVSVMRLVKEMDAGPILAQEKIAITPETTKQSLYESLAQAGAKALLDVLPAVVAKNASESPQNQAQASFTAQLTKDLSKLDTASKTAETLSNEIRAFAGFPKSKLTLLNIPCVITTAHVADTASSELDQKCADGKYLVIDRLIPENSKEMDARAFLNGHKK